MFFFSAKSKQTESVPVLDAEHYCPLWFRRTGLLLWPSATQKETQHSYFSQGSQELGHPVGFWMTYSRKLFLRQQAAQSGGAGTFCIPTIASSVIWVLSIFRTVQSCMWAGCPVIPWCKFLSGPMICCTKFLYVRERREVPAGTSELMSEAARAGPESQSPPLPLHFWMSLLFTCKTWASPPCSNHTLKTGTPYQCSIAHFSHTHTHPSTSMLQPK